jgi:hypothetical protein
MSTIGPVRWGWPVLVVLLGVCGLILVGCPEQGDDDDDDAADDDDDISDDDAGDDDAGDDDAGDDDAGDDDAQGDGSGTWTVTDVPDCGEVRSVVWFQNAERAYDGIFASSEPHTCADWVAADEAKAAAWSAWDAEMTKASGAQDGPAACTATTTYYTTLEQWDSSIWPAGSCTLEMHPDSFDPGEYMAGFDKARGFAVIWGAWYVAIESYFAPHVAHLDAECPGVSSWADWSTVEKELWNLGGDSEFWDFYDGTVTLATGEDLHVTSTGMIVMEWSLATEGTLDFDLQAASCPQ